MLNSIDDMTEADLGFAKVVYEQQLGEDKYTFIEGVENPFSCTILIKGPNDYSIA
jgi:T-complex protein 1 subunit zeta